MYRHCFFEKEYSLDKIENDETPNDIIQQLNFWETPVVFCQDSIYIQYLDKIYIINSDQKPKCVTYIPNLRLQNKNNATFHIGCINNQILIISDAVYLLQPDYRLKQVSIYYDMKVVPNLCSFQIFEFCGINVLYDMQIGILYELSNDMTIRQVSNVSISKILFFGSGLLVYQHKVVFSEDRPFSQCYMLNLFTMQEKKIARPHLEKWNFDKISKIVIFSKTGYIPIDDALEGMLGDDLNNYKASLEAKWYQHLISQTPSVNQSGYSSIDKDLSSCFTVIK